MNATGRGRSGCHRRRASTPAVSPIAGTIIQAGVSLDTSTGTGTGTGTSTGTSTGFSTLQLDDQELLEGRLHTLGVLQCILTMSLEQAHVEHRVLARQAIELGVGEGTRAQLGDESHPFLCFRQLSQYHRVHFCAARHDSKLLHHHLHGSLCDIVNTKR